MSEPDWNHRSLDEHPSPESASAAGEPAMTRAFVLEPAPADEPQGTALSEVWDYLGKH